LEDLIGKRAFIVQRVSKVPQPVGPKRAVGKENLGISTLLAGTNIAETHKKFSPCSLRQEFIEQVRLSFLIVGGSVNETT
jgi:hypothetical protein